MTWSVQPEPADESERQALLAAIERALAEDEAAGEGYVGAWWRAGLEDLGGGPAAQESWRDARIVEP